MKLIVGLGNPGREYENTRHNLGFWIVDNLAQKLSGEIKQKKFNGLYYQNKNYLLLSILTNKQSSFVTLTMPHPFPCPCPASSWPMQFDSNYALSNP